MPVTVNRALQEHRPEEWAQLGGFAKRRARTLVRLHGGDPAAAFSTAAAGGVYDRFQSQPVARLPTRGGCASMGYGH